MNNSVNETSANSLFDKNRISSILIVLWIAVPALYLLNIPSKNLYDIILFSTVALEVLFIQANLVFKKGKDLIALLFLGVLLQTLWLIAVIFWIFPGTTVTGIPFFFFIIFYQLLLPELGLAAILTVPFFLFKKSPEYAKKVALIGLAIILLAGSIPYLKSKEVAEEKSQVINYDTSAVSFRYAAKEKTTLGQYPRPLRIIKKEDGSFIGIPLDHQRLSLPFLDSIHPDQYRNAFFDIFKDRIFYIQNGKAFVFDMAQKKSTLLPKSIQAALEEKAACDKFAPCNKREIAGVHNNTIALETHSLGSDVAVFDLTSGKRLQESIFDGYDTSRIYILWLHGKGYRLFINSTFPEVRKDPAEKRAVMQIYLDKEPDPYHMPSDKEFEQKWGELFEYYLKKKQPIASLESIYNPNEKTAGVLSVRNLYDLGNDEIALEVENKLIIIDPATQKIRFTSSEREIENILSQATLLSVDVDDHFHQGYCSFDNEIYHVINAQKGEFMFCLL